jgi:patatin-like phospholipase/acyl hydrolase
MRNILSLDGGGTRGIFSLQILARIEALLRQKYGKPDLVLADHFDFIGGTSTGAIIAACLSWGVSVATLEKFYLEQSYQVFGRKTWFSRLRSKYSAHELTRLLRKFFAEENGEPALLGSKKLKTLYLCVMRNATTGAPWIITNSPHAKYNDPGLPDSNLRIPLYQLIRASTAAPIFFRPEEISHGGQSWMFLDGAVTPYNNPAFIMYLIATLPCFGNKWEDGEKNLRIVSVGTGRMRVRFSKSRAHQINVVDQAAHAVNALIDSNNQHQDLTCRAFGRCLFGEPLDSEIGTLMAEEMSQEITGGHPKRFLYCRYNRNLSPDEIAEASKIPHFFSVDNLQAIHFLQALGKRFAEQNVRLEHLVS